MPQISYCQVCLSLYFSRGPQGEGIIQLSYNFYDCAVKWGQLSKLPRATFLSELNKAVQAEPLDVKFKYWEACWQVLN